jgi:hypothetical protein
MKVNTGRLWESGPWVWVGGGLLAGASVQAGQWPAPGRETCRQTCVARFRLELHDTDGAALHEEQVIGKACGQGKLAHGHAQRGAKVEFVAILNPPASRVEQLVYSLSSFFFRCGHTHSTHEGPRTRPLRTGRICFLGLPWRPAARWGYASGWMIAARRLFCWNVPIIALMGQNGKLSSSDPDTGESGPAFF